MPKIGDYNSEDVEPYENLSSAYDAITAELMKRLCRREIRSMPVSELIAAGTFLQTRLASHAPAWMTVKTGTPRDKTIAVRAAALRDYLIDLLSYSPPSSVEELALRMDGKNGRPAATSDEVRDAIVSIGAVQDGRRLRLSNGPPHGWRWAAYGTSYRRHLLARDNCGDMIVTVEEGADGCRWRLFVCKLPFTQWVICDSVDDAKDASLLACRKHGLFSPASSESAQHERPNDDSSEARSDEKDPRP